MESLKERLTQHFHDQTGEVDQEEIDNTIEVLEALNDDLSNLGKWQQQLLLRMINDSQLFAEVDKLYNEPLTNEFDDNDPFDC